jgi:hypothetical protein
MNSGSESMTDVPSGIERRFLTKEHAPKLAQRHRLFALEYGVQHFKPRHQWHVGVLEYSPD